MWITTPIFFWGEILTCFSTHSRTKHEPKKGAKSRGKNQENVFKGHQTPFFMGVAFHF
jgi:hypothetical protein